MGNDLGKLLLRLSVGGLILLHGIHKLLAGIGPIKQMIAAHGLPDLLAYGVYLGEIAGPALVILGLFSRIGGALIVIDLIVAIVLTGESKLLLLNGSGGYALELEALYLAGGLAIVLMGAGRMSIGGEYGRLN